MTGRERAKSMPEIPTVAESGYPGFEVDAWYGVLAPARTAKEIVSQLPEIVRVRKRPKFASASWRLGWSLWERLRKILGASSSRTLYGGRRS